MNSIFYFFVILLFLIITGRSFQKDNFQITPLLFFYFLLLIDVFIPAFIFELTELPNYPYYFGYIDKENIFYSVVIFIFTALFFTWGYRTKVIKIFDRKKESTIILRYKLVYVFYFITIIIVMLNIFTEIRNSGGLSQYYDFKIKRVYLDTIQPSNFIEKLLFFISSKSTSLLIMFNGVLFYNRHRYNKSFMWGVIFPVITFTIILTSLHRGTILNFFISLIVLEIFRIQKYNLVKYSNSTVKILKKITNIGIFTVIIFLFFGTIRGRLNSSAWGNDQTFVESFLSQIQNNFGVSLLSLSRVTNYFNSSEVFLLGKTINEMFYFFMPRWIYPEKPIQYGIITANKIMGSPSSTMDAITIPGELIANFGIFGILLTFLFGYFYKLISHMTYNDHYIPVYAILISTVTVTFWMSFTGLFAQMIYLPLYLFIINLLYKKQTNIKEKYNISSFIR